MNLLIFDLDGTLIDSKLDLVHSVNAARGLMNLEPISEELVSSYVGNGAPVLMRRALGPEASDADVARALEYFLSYYRAHMLDNTRLYPGVREALDRLLAGGSKMAVLTLAHQPPNDMPSVFKIATGPLKPDDSTGND